MEDIISKMKKGEEVLQKDLKKITSKLVRFFKKKGFGSVKQSTRKGGSLYIYIRVKGEVPESVFIEACNICPASKTYVSKPDGVIRTDYYSYFWV